jgi:hypothetical protein
MSDDSPRDSRRIPDDDNDSVPHPTPATLAQSPAAEAGRVSEEQLTALRERWRR